MLNKEQFYQILEKYQRGEASKEERNFIDAYYDSFNLKTDLTEGKDLTAENFSWSSIKSEIDLRIDAHEQKQQRRKQLRLYTKWSVAAAVIFIAAFIYLSQNTSVLMHNQSSFVKNDIVPGRNRATIKLINGNTVELSDAKTGIVIHSSQLSYNDGSKVAVGSTTDNFNTGNGKETKYNEIRTPKGGTYQITLTDGTKVWLNSDSKLEFPEQFGPVRKVRLTGEAYFEVAKHSIAHTSEGIAYSENTKKIPFIVESSQQQVEVLGTHFNINAYTDAENTKTTLLEGAVRVVNLKTKSSGMLKPGEQSALSNEQLQISKADLEEAVAWKNGMFIFNGQDLESIMKQVSRWYDVTVTYEDPKIRKQIFDGSVSRFHNISQLLEVLESTGSVHFKLAGRRLTVMN